MGVISAMLLFSVFAVLLAYASAGSVICSDYTGGGGAYYTHPIPMRCRSAHLGWRPNFKLKNFASRCPGGYRKWKNHCYQAKEQGQNFKDHEESCNREKGHLCVFNSQREMNFNQPTFSRTTLVDGLA